MVDLNKIVRQNILDLKPYSSARDEFSGESAVFLDANENPFGDLNRYPDPYQRKLKNKISDVKGVPTQNIFVGNGSDEAIDLVFRIFCEPGVDKALQFVPTYGMYEVQAQIHDVEMINYSLDESFQIRKDSIGKILQEENLKLIFICSPNNPTGNRMDDDLIQEILNQFEGIVVMDEAYIDFSLGSSWKGKVKTFSNLLVLQTLSKAWSLAGARVGIAFANEKIISLFNKVKAPYNVSELNQKAAIEILSDGDSFRKNIRIILDERERVQKKLESLSIVSRVYPSEANFLLAQVENANQIYSTLSEKNIIIRNRSGQIKNGLRITIGTYEENNRLIKALEDEESTFYR